MAVCSQKKSSKHRDIPKCACGGIPTVLHVSWCCPLRADVRDPCLSSLGHNGDSFPTCFRYATILPAGSLIPVEHVVQVQETLVTIWQRNIQAYHQKQNLETPPEAECVPISQQDTTEYVSNGHQIAPRINNPGVWCKKCGLYVARLRHVRLQISGKPCQQASLAPSHWLTQEGFHRPQARLADLEASLQQYNTDANRLVKSPVGKTKAEYHVPDVAENGLGSTAIIISRDPNVDPP